MANVIPGATTGFYAGVGASTGPTSGFYSTATQPVASATPTSGGANPTTGAYYSKIQTDPAPAASTNPTPAPAPALSGGADAYAAAQGPTYGYSTANGGVYDSSGAKPGDLYTTTDQNVPFVAGNGTYGALGTNAPAAGVPSNTGKAPTSAPGAGTGTDAGTTSGAPGATAPTPGMLSGPGYDEAWFAAHGNDLSGPSKSSQLYDEGVNATNPYYQHAIDETNKAINLASAARGTGNSGAALAEIGTADANLLGQQALAQENLAGQADTADTSRFGASSTAAGSAQTQTQNRGNSAAAAYTGLSADQANTVDKFYSMATSGQLTGDMASIEAQLAASGVDAATAQAITNDLLGVAALGVKAAGSGH